MTTAKRKNNLTWLHLSDLHMCHPQTGWEADRILQKLEEDLEQLNQDFNLKPDLIFFTGDIAFGELPVGQGKSITQQYKDAAVFFKKACAVLDLPIENLFLVPGNHDVNRSKISLLVHSGLEQYKVEEDITKLIQTKRTDWATCMKRLTDYWQFLSDLGCTHLLQDPDRLVYGVTREINGVSVGIAGFNAVWASRSDRDRGRLYMGGHWQVESMLQKMGGADVKFALMHHPFSWLNHLEGTKVDEEVKNGFHLFLHGHEHRDGVEELVEKYAYARISAGACYGDSEEEMGYNIGSLDTEAGTSCIWLRKYDARGGGWIPHVMYKKTDQQGRVHLDHVAAAIKRGIEGKRKSKTGARSSKDSKPFVPKANSPESRGVFGRGGDIKKIADVLENKKIIGIYGMAGVGKSKLIDEVRRQREHKKKAYVRYRMTPRTDVDDLFHELARVLGCRDEAPKADFIDNTGAINGEVLGKYAEYAKPALIHLEDAHFLFDKNKKDKKNPLKKVFRRRSVAAFLAAVPRYFPGTRIILESRIDMRKVFDGETADTYQAFRIGGIGKAAVTDYFRRPFKDDPESGWELGPNETDHVYAWLGDKRSGGAHPFAMMLLANVAKGVNKKPNVVLKGYGRRKVLKDLENQLFNDLYHKVLTQKERQVLELIVKIDPESARHQRFLVERIEMLEDKRRQ